MLAVIAVFALHAEYSSIRREVKEGMYTPVSYMVAHAMLQIPFMIVLSIASLAIPAYGISNFYGPNFGSVILVYSCMLWAFECCAQFFSVAISNPLLGMLYCTLTPPAGLKFPTTASQNTAC